MRNQRVNDGCVTAAGAQYYFRYAVRFQKRYQLKDVLFIGVHRLLFSVVCNGQHGLQLLFRFVPFVG